MTTPRPSSQAMPAVCFAEIRQIIAQLPRLAPVSVPNITPYGRLGEWVLWLAKAQGKQPELRHMRLALFAGAHGYAPDNTQTIRDNLRQISEGNAPVVAMIQSIDADLRVYELDLDTPTADYRHAPALSEDQAAHAMAYGMMAVEAGVQLLALSTVGNAHAEVYQDLLKNLPQSEDPLATLAHHGGLECCAMLGALLAARLAKVPVLLDGPAAEAAAAVLAQLSAESTHHAAAAQSLEPEITSENGTKAALGMAKLKTLCAAIR